MEEIKATTEKPKKKKQTDTQPTLQQTLVRTTLYPKESAKKKNRQCSIGNDCVRSAATIHCC